MVHTLRQRLPRVVQIGQPATLDLDLYDDTGQLTATVATVRVVVGGVELLASTAATTLGPPASLTLASGVTTGQQPSESWVEEWSVTVGGVALAFERKGYLVRTLYHPGLVDDDLIDADADLLNLLPSTKTTLEHYRRRAAEKVQRDLLRKNRYPWLVFDVWQLTDAHIHLSLSYIYRDLAIKMGSQTRYAEEATRRLEAYDAEMEQIVFQDVADEDDELFDGADEPAVMPTPRSGNIQSRSWEQY